MVRFARYLEVIDEERLVENARVVGDHLLPGCEEVQAGAGRPDVERARPRADDRLRPAGRRRPRDRVHRKLIENGLLLLTCGPRSIRFRPPLNLSPADADAALEIVRKTLTQL